LKEGSYLDGLCDLAIERHFNLFMKTANDQHFVSKSADEITTLICEALVKDLEYEIWQRIAPKMLPRVEEMKRLASDATGENRIT
ncbi:MAG: hypothetical protein HKN08_12750, partial [Gammaproteobacteria bacterium]|nr:hypothetical protein [Gammaproteobacteria bacterium]